MDAKLVVVGGKASKGSIPLKLPTVIGRSRDATLKLAHPMISRQHCEIYEAGGLLMIRDLGSLNGTVVGGERIKVAPLPPEGEFSVGPLTFRAEYQYDGDLSALPAPVLAEKNAKAAPAVAAPTESPDFEAVDDAIPLESDAPAAKPPSSKAGKLTKPKPGKAASPAKPATEKKSGPPAGNEKKSSPHTVATKAKPAAAGGAKPSEMRSASDKTPTEQAPAKDKSPAKAAPGKRPGDQPEDPFDAFLNELG
ncbi:MAG: FHA domain-containing protein [Planctomycetaceae bacterium]|nr:FHA domain-containing protein [Planctomycetaceae bacterium]